MRSATGSTRRKATTSGVLPQRPVEVTLNGQLVGTLDGIWKSEKSFESERGMWRFGEVNRLGFETANAGPVAGDSRVLGFSLIRVRVEGVFVE